MEKLTNESMRPISQKVAERKKKGGLDRLRI